MISNRYAPVALVCALAFAPQVKAAVSAEEAAKLKTTLTPLGAERAGNKEGTIPAWEGGIKHTPHVPGSGKIADLFGEDKPLFTITAQNVAQYADKLTDGEKALLQKYPAAYRLPVYQTRRTGGAAPQWVYDNTFHNATRSEINPKGSLGAFPVKAYGGTPFPIPKTGEEAIWNHLLRWNGQTITTTDGEQGRVTPDGKVVIVQQSTSVVSWPYYNPESNLEKFEAAGATFVVRRINSSGPPIRAGEMIVGRTAMDDSKSETYTYLTGQRRVRRLPLSCCDIPNPVSGGIANFDELTNFFGSIGRYDWKLLGKREMYIPYNMNKIHQPKTAQEVLAVPVPNPDLSRFELHRVWVVEATLKAGERHSAPKARFYLDEDTWLAVTADRWDAQGNLWKVSFVTPTAMPDVPALIDTDYMVFDMIRGGYYMSTINKGQSKALEITDKQSPDSYFTGEALSGEGVR